MTRTERRRSSDRGDAPTRERADPPSSLTTLELGESVHCSNGTLGVLSDIVLEPLSRRITHLVVRPHEPLAPARLIPYELVLPDQPPGPLTLTCTAEEAQGMKSVRAVTATAVDGSLPEDPDWEVGVQDVQPVPHYDAGAFADYGPSADFEVVRIYDRIPRGHVELRHESSVITGDGHNAGALVGLQVEGDRVTQLLLGRGHLWWRRRLAVPVEELASVATDEVQLRSSASELGKARP